MSFFADVVEIPRTAPSSAMQNSADQRTSLAGDGLFVLRTADLERCSGVDGLGWVEVGPAGGEVELAGGRSVLGLRVRRGSRRAGRRR